MNAAIHPDLIPVLISLALLIGAFSVNHAVARVLRRNSANRSPEILLSRLVTARNGLGVVVIVALLMVWVRELGGFVLSIAAVAGAMLIVSKELIMCGLGTMMRTVSRPFQIGDVIEVGNWRGKVIDSDILTTTLLEMGPARQFTGSHTQLPNSIFLGTPVKNLSVTGQYFLNFLKVPLPIDANVDALRLLLLDAAIPVVKPFEEDAAEHIQRIADLHLIELPSATPKVLIDPVDALQTNIVLRFACPVEQWVSIEQQILGRFYAAAAELRAETGPHEPARLPPKHR